MAGPAVANPHMEFVRVSQFRIAPCGSLVSPGWTEGPVVTIVLKTPMVTEAPVMPVVLRMTTAPRFVAQDRL